MTTPIKLHRPRPVSGVVAKLREILEAAERGEVVGFAIVYEDNERCVSTRMGGASDDDAKWIGHVFGLQMRLHEARQARMIQTDDPDEGR